MVTVSAIPANLHKYSAGCTKAEDALLTWIYTQLKPALDAYRSKKGTGVDASLGEDLMREVAAARATDHSVRLVGMAFLQADSADGNMPTPLESLYGFLFGPSETSRLESATKPLKVDEKLFDGLWFPQNGQDIIGAPPGRTLALVVQKAANDLGVPSEKEWEFTLSGELWGAYYLPFPSVDPDGTRFSSRENAVLSLVKLREKVILREAKERNISPQAIVAAIAWEALENPSPSDYGLGKVHFDADVVREIEKGESPLRKSYLPGKTTGQRAELLRTPEGAIKYIAAIMSAYADVTENTQNKEKQRYPSIRYNVPMLVHLYQGGGPQENLTVWASHLKNKKTTALEAVSPMAEWVTRHQQFLDLAMPKKP
ncbi:hypothetical protein AB0H03_40280 [Streptomyces sparsogenes]|uniref:hypothetical protein n=1 Tax=Streptomyces sparsogenes TaxID=67365 RepID=UPI0033FD8B2E